MSWHDLLAPARAPAPRWTPTAAQEGQAQAAGGAAAQAWPATAHANLAGVRVHADAEAQSLVEDYGAKAFTYGQDVFLGAGAAGGGPDGAATLAHETAHVAQQATQPGPALQFEPKGQKAGPGASPPDDDFITDENNWGSEDQHVLFGQDQASLDADDEVQAFAARQKQAVSVFVHGYASEEGPADYNLNLSAQRGAVIRRRLLELLPQGSKVTIFAHGKTQHFGAADKNRRVGLSLIGPVDRGAQLHVDFPGRLPSWRERLHLVDPPRVSYRDLLDVGLPPPPVIAPTGTSLRQVPAAPPVPHDNIDLAGFGAAAGMRGHTVGETGNVLDQYDDAYRRYRFGWGIPDHRVLSLFGLFDYDIGATALANKELQSNIEAYWQRNDPSAIDRSNQDVGAHVFMSPNLLELGSDKKKKKESK